MNKKGAKKDDLDPRRQEQDKNNPKILNREVYFKGKTIIAQGDTAYRAFYIEKGRVEVIGEEDGVSVKIAELGPGDIFGEMGLIEHRPRTATVRAMDDVTVTVISRDEIEGKIKRIDDKAIRALINLLIERLRVTTKGQVQQYKTLSEFQDRITGIVDRVDGGIDESKRSKFRDEVMPLLSDLQDILDRYQH
jgi:CRP-like cAMP-binding protein